MMLSGRRVNSQSAIYKVRENNFDVLKDMTEFTHCVTVPPGEAPAWSGPCPLWTAGPSGRERGRPGSGGERPAGWEHKRAATGTETAGW